MTVINTNVKSLLAQNSLKANNRSLTTAMEQLSTGKRINSAKDDAAGLAISSRMTSQIRGLNQAVRNANDGISLLQTAEGSLIEVTNMLQRMRELAIQAGTDTNTVSDRSYLDDEFQQLKNEINRVAAQTQWNGMNILNGNDDFGTVAGNEQTVSFQVGPNQNQTIDVNFKDFTFTSSSSGVTASSAQINLGSANSGTDAVGRFSATIDGVNVDIDITGFTSDPSAGNASTLATELEAGIRAYSGLESVSVSVVDEVITLTNPTGGSFGSFAFEKDDGTAVTFTTAPQVTYVAGSSGTGAAPAGGVFTGSAAIHSSLVTTKSHANSAVVALDAAIEAVNTERSTYGSVINRLTYAVDNLSNISMNTSDARSRIQDADYASATTELARTQIVQQAATAILAQANQQPQSVLSLLQ